jgi:hypothetical protein
MSLIVIEPAIPALLMAGAVCPFTAEEIERLRHMANDYARVVHRKPFANHCIMAFEVCVHAVELPAEILRAKDRGNPPLCVLRQQMMAFSRVVSLRDTTRINSWKGLGRAFNRTHAAVMAATKKYGPAIEEVLA